MSKELLTLALEAVEIGFKAEQYMTDADYALQDKAVAALREALAEPDFWEGYVPEPVKPAQPVAFPTRRAVEREIERTANPTGMHLNDGKERVALPGGTLRHMLALIDRTSPPSLSLAQRKPLTDEEIRAIDTSAFWNDHTALDFARAIEAAHGIKENT